MFIDSHCHIDSYEEQSKESFDTLLECLKKSNSIKKFSSFKEKDASKKFALPKAFIHVACNPNDFEYARVLSEKYSFVYSSYGIHPEFAKKFIKNDETLLLKYLKEKKCIACGEFGLDYHYGIDSKKEQKILFEKQLEIGIKYNKPLVLHLREADEDSISILKNFNLRYTKLHIHCFTSSPKFAEQLLSLNTQIFIGFTGIITFKNAQNVREAAKIVPINQILLETDSPYMSPEPFRGKPSHSGMIPFIAEKLSEIKQISIKDIYNHCIQNTKNCYGI